MKEAELIRGRMKLVDSSQCENVEQVLPVPVRHVHALLGTFAFDRTEASTDRLYKKMEVGKSRARMILEEPAKRHVKELLVAFPIMDAPERPDNSEGESWVFSPGLGKIVINDRPRYTRTYAIECIECGRKSGTKGRRIILSMLVVSSRTERIHHSIELWWRIFGDHFDKASILRNRKENVKEVGIGELRDSGESDVLGGSSSKGGSHNGSCGHPCSNGRKKRVRSDKLGCGAGGKTSTTKTSPK